MIVRFAERGTVHIEEDAILEWFGAILKWKQEEEICESRTTHCTHKALRIPRSTESRDKSVLYRVLASTAFRPEQSQIISSTVGHTILEIFD